MQRLTVRTEFGLRLLWREQSKTTEGEDTAQELGKRAVAAMFPNGGPSSSVAEQLQNAIARVERCRAEDTSKDGAEHPTPMTLSTLQTGNLHESVAELPKRIGELEMSPATYVDEYGRPLNRWNDARKIWEPIEYE